jgi:hypothetical protein
MLSEPNRIWTVNRPPTGPRALANINFDTVEESDTGALSQEEISGINAGPQNPWPVIGICISNVQTHLANHKTPTAAKATAIEESGVYLNQIRGQRDQFRLGDIEEDVSTNQPNNFSRVDGSAYLHSQDSYLGSEDQDAIPQLQPPFPSQAGPRKVQNRKPTEEIVRQGFRK